MRDRSEAAVYDKAGNLTSWNQNTYEIDAFDQIRRYKTAADLEWTYFYNASDERVWIYKSGGDDSRWTLRGFGNQVLREYNATANTWSIRPFKKPGRLVGLFPSAGGLLQERCRTFRG